MKNMEIHNYEIIHARSWNYETLFYIKLSKNKISCGIEKSLKNMSSIVF